MDTREIPVPLHRVLSKLKDVRHSGGLMHEALCPTHDDVEPSLSVGWGDNNEVILHCHAGCETKDILAKLGMKWIDLKQQRTAVATYPYENEDGELVYEVVRYDPKEFRQRRPDPANPRRHIWNLDGVDPIPYRLPDLAETVAHGTDDDQIWIVEGEKDTDVLRQTYDVTATCNSGGAGKWTDAHSAYFVGFAGSVIVVVDKDEKPSKPGQKHALAVHESLLRVAGIDAELVYPAVGKDAADHVSDYGPDDFTTVTPDELRAEIAAAGGESQDDESEFDAKVQAELERIEVREAARRTHAAAQATGLFQGFNDTSLREALSAPREVIPSIIDSLQSAGHKAFLIAQFKAGKTTLSGNVVKSLADHEPFLGRFAVHDLAGNIGVLDYELTEDDALDMYRAMGLRNQQRVFLQSLRGTGFTLANESHRDMLIGWCVAHDVEYLTVDPFGRAMKGFGEENSNDDVRAFLMGLDFVMREANLLGILMPVHTGRAATEIGSERARGATVIDDDADARWILTRDAQSRRFFRADGRKGVGVEEVGLDFDAGLNRLTVADISRQDSAGERFLGPVLNHIENNPGAVLRDIKSGVEGTDKQIAAAVGLCIKQGLVRREVVGNAHHHYLVTDAPARRLVLHKEATDE